MRIQQGNENVCNKGMGSYTTRGQSRAQLSHPEMPGSIDDVRQTFSGQKEYGTYHHSSGVKTPSTPAVAEVRWSGKSLLQASLLPSISR